MKKTMITLAACTAIGIASLGGVAAANAATPTPLTSTGQHGAVGSAAPSPSDVDPALQEWCDNNDAGERPAGVKVIGSPAELAALEASAKAQGEFYRSKGYDVAIADVAAGEEIQIPEDISDADLAAGMTIGQNVYDAEYERLGGE